MPVDPFGQCAVRLAAGTRMQALPEEGVVPSLRGSFEQAALAVADDLLQRRLCQSGAGDAGVDRLYLGAVMLAMVQLQRRG